MMFACHSQAHQNDPSLSAILLQDCLIKPPCFSVRAILSSVMEDCEIVYLPSFEFSANKSLTLADEGINIAGGFHMVGVPYTVLGMWQLEDRVPHLRLRRRFLRELKDGEVVDGYRALEYWIRGRKEYKGPLIDDEVKAVMWIGSIVAI